MPPTLHPGIGPIFAFAAYQPYWLLELETSFNDAIQVSRRRSATHQRCIQLINVRSYSQLMHRANMVVSIQKIRIIFQYFAGEEYVTQIVIGRLYKLVDVVSPRLSKRSTVREETAASELVTVRWAVIFPQSVHTKPNPQVPHQRCCLARRARLARKLSRAGATRCREDSYSTSQPRILAPQDPHTFPDVAGEHIGCQY